MIRYLRPVSWGSARGAVREVYRQIKEEFGTLGEPLTLHSPLPDLLVGVWCSFREALLAGRVARGLKEAVAVAVSKLNRCPYCIDAHTVMLRAASSHDAASSVQYDRDEEIGDPKTRAFVEWSRATRSPGSAVLATPPFTFQEAPEIIGTAVWIHYINRMAKTLLEDRLLPFSSNPLGLRSLSERLGGWYFSGTVSRRLEPGASLNLHDEAVLPEDLAWAIPSPAVARAFAVFATAVEKEGSGCLSLEVRACVAEQLAGWDGGDPGPGAIRITGALEILSPSDRPAGRLSLLAALAPDQLSDKVIREFAVLNPGDKALLGALAWSSFTAARKIGTWLKVGSSPPPSSYEGCG